MSTLHQTDRTATPPIRTRTPRQLETQITATQARPPAPQREQDLLRAAFRDLHGARLHGFALLVAAGDRSRAAAAAAEALSAGAERAVALRHPERAAAWLRARALPRLRRAGSGTGLDAAAREALADLGASEAVADAIAALSIEERAALVATLVEGLEPMDVETILASSARHARRTIARAREHYLAAVRSAVSASQPSPPAGALTAAVLRVAGQAMGGAPRHRLGAEAPR